MQTHPTKSNDPEAICLTWFLWQSIIPCLHLGPRLVSQLRCENTKLPLSLPWVVMAAAQQNQDEFSDQEIFSNTSQLPGSSLVFFLLSSYASSTVRKSTAGDCTRLGETGVTWFWGCTGQFNIKKGAPHSKWQSLRLSHRERRPPWLWVGSYWWDVVT